jgi:mevalonate kinase
MAKITSKNNEFLFSAKDSTSLKIYPLLVDLVNDDREDLARLVKKVDYLLEYTSICIKQKDFKQAKETINNVHERLSFLENQNVHTEYLRYLYDGIKNKIK